MTKAEIQWLAELLHLHLDEDRKLELQGTSPEYRIMLLRSALHWKIKEMQRDLEHQNDPTI